MSYSILAYYTMAQRTLVKAWIPCPEKGQIRL